MHERMRAYIQKKNTIWRSVVGNIIMHTSYVLHGLPGRYKEEPSKSAASEKRLLIE